MLTFSDHMITLGENTGLPLILPYSYSLWYNEESIMLTWRIHSGLIENRESEMENLLLSLGDRVQFVRGHWRDLPPALSPEAGEAGGLALTTLQDACALPEKGWGSPRLLYFDRRKYDVSYWLPRISDGIPVLNRQMLFLPAGQISWIPVPLGASPFPLSNGLLFVRPDSALKPFPGIVLDCDHKKLRNWQDVAHEVARVVPGLAPEKLICIAPGRQLNRLEWRFWIVDRKVVAATPYSWEEGGESWEEPPAEAQRIAQEMATNAWQPDIAYVADVVQLATGDEPFYLNEINAASTSGFYSVPFEPLIAALRAAVQRELTGELSVED